MNAKTEQVKIKNDGTEIQREKSCETPKITSEKTGKSVNFVKFLTP